MKVLQCCMLLSVMTLAGCVTAKHEVEVKEPVRVQVDPIHITLDVNIRVEKEVDDAFAFLYEEDAEGGN